MNNIPLTWEKWEDTWEIKWAVENLTNENWEQKYWEDKNKLLKEYYNIKNLREEIAKYSTIANHIICKAEEVITNNAYKVKEEDKKEAEEAISELKKVLENASATKEELEPATKKVNDIMMKVGQVIYAQPGTKAGATEDKKDDWVVDAEEDKGEDKKNERV